jgi:hypothetical protein
MGISYLCCVLMFILKMTTQSVTDNKIITKYKIPV